MLSKLKKCQSRAISNSMNAEKEQHNIVSAESVSEMSPNGTLLFYSNMTVKKSDGNATQKIK